MSFVTLNHLPRPFFPLISNCESLAFCITTSLATTCFSGNLDDLIVDAVSSWTPIFVMVR